jgi:hypothetical protein
MEEVPKPNLLKDLIGKSWNLELIISGAAIVLTTYLPDFTDEMFYYYHNNLNFEEHSKMAVLPILAFAFLKTVSYLLIGMFVAHLVMRSFWVALIGLQAAFPQGIRFDKLPNMSKGIQDFQEKKYGTLEAYIIRLDRSCSQVLGLAFLIALLGAGIGIVYQACFWIAHFFKMFLSESIVTTTLKGLYFLFLVFIPLIVWYNYKSKKEAAFDLKYGGFVGSGYYYFSNILFPFISKPMNFLSMTFSSNIPRKQYYIGMLPIIILLLGGGIVLFFEKLSELRNIHILEPRTFYSKGNRSTELNAFSYDNLRPNENRIPAVSVTSDIETGAFLKIFVNYPKSLDIELNKKCALPTYLESLPKEIVRFKQDSISLLCIQDFFQLYINDSLQTKIDWMFQQKNAKIKGLVIYFPTNKLKEGKNIVEVKKPHWENVDSMIVYGTLPVWFAKE